MTTIITHNGQFHADEVFAVSVLTTLYPESTVIRTRNKAEFNDCDFLVDVGGEYNPDLGRYDHHQTGGAATRDNGIPYASAGLIWKHFGQAYLKKVLNTNSQVSAELAQTIDNKLVVHIDSMDTGCWIKNNPNVEVFSLSTVINYLNFVDPMNDEMQQHHFLRAVDMMNTILVSTVTKELDNLEKLSTFLSSVHEQAGNDVLHLDEYYPLYQNPHISTFKYVVYPSANEFRIQATKPEYYFAEQYRGKPTNKLPANVVFVHNNGFLAGTTTKEAALQLIGE